MSEPTCTESAPCFACLACAICMLNLLPEAERRAYEGGQLRGDGSDGTITIKAHVEATLNICTPHVATLPDGSRVSLPAGTVLRGAPIEREAARAVNFAALKRMAPSLAAVHERAAAKAGCAPWDVTEEQLWEECPNLRLADLTERADHAKEMAPTVGPLMANGVPVAEVTSIAFNKTAAPFKPWPERIPVPGGAWAHTGGGEYRWDVPPAPEPTSVTEAIADHAKPRT